MWLIGEEQSSVSGEPGRALVNARHHVKCQRATPPTTCWRSLPWLYIGNSNAPVHGVKRDNVVEGRPPPVVAHVGGVCHVADWEEQSSASGSLVRY